MEDNKIIITGEDGETKEFFVEEAIFWYATVWTRKHRLIL